MLIIVVVRESGAPTYADQESWDGSAALAVDHGQQAGEMSLSGSRETQSGTGI